MKKTISLASAVSMALSFGAVAQQHTYEATSAEQPAVFSASDSGDQTVDVVMFYQPIYERKMGGFEAVKNRADAMIAKANEIYADSDAGVTLNLVELREITGLEDSLPFNTETDKFGNEYQQSASTVAAGRALNSTGYYDDDDVYQDNYPEYLVYERFAGDIAGYITDNRLHGNGNSIGAASVGGEFFSVSDLLSLDPADIISLTTLAHETGHNFGARHEIDDAPNTGDHPVEAHAWTCGSERTVMWSGNNGREEVFSSPLIERDGEPCGVAGEADNVSVIKGTKQSVAERRSKETDIGIVAFTSTSFTGSEESGEALISIERDGDVSEPTSVLVQLTSGTGSSNGDVHVSHKRFEFEAGQSVAEFAFPVVQDGIAEGDETLNVEMHFPYRLIPSLIGDSATLTIEDDYDGQPGSIEISSESTDDGLMVTLNRVNGSDGELVVNAQSKLAFGSEIPLPAIYFEQAAHDFVFADGETQKTFTVKTQSGDEPMGDREILVSAVVAGDYETISKTVIVGDTQAGDFDYGLSAGSATTADSSVRVTVTRSGSTELSSVVTVTSSNGSLTAGNDFEAVEEQVTFSAGDTTASFNVNLLSSAAGNFELETSSGESVTVTVTAASTGGGSDGGSGGGSDGGSSGGSTGLFTILALLMFTAARRFVPGRRA